MKHCSYSIPISESAQYSLALVLWCICDSHVQLYYSEWYKVIVVNYSVLAKFPVRNKLCFIDVMNAHLIVTGFEKTLRMGSAHDSRNARF